MQKANMAQVVVLPNIVPRQPINFTCPVSSAAAPRKIKWSLRGSLDEVFTPRDNRDDKWLYGWGIWEGSPKSFGWAVVSMIAVLTVIIIKRFEVIHYSVGHTFCVKGPL